MDPLGYGSTTLFLEGYVNTAPTISGTPPTTAPTGRLYSFTPTAEDINDDTLTFELVNRPDWASTRASLSSESRSGGIILKLESVDRTSS